jgi:ketosteroid isomerase-like protein
MNRRQSIITGLAGVTAVAGLTSKAPAAEPKAGNPEQEAIRAVLRAHDDALTNHDLKGVLATMTPKTVIMGCGPGEIWSGTAEIKDAYQHFFEGFDKGHQVFHYNFRFGGLSSEMGWLGVSGEISGQKDGKPVAFPINISVAMEKSGGSWRIALLHFSNLTGADGGKARS